MCSMGAETLQETASREPALKLGKNTARFKQAFQANASYSGGLVSQELPKLGGARENAEFACRI